VAGDRTLVAREKPAQGLQRSVFRGERPGSTQ